MAMPMDDLFLDSGLIELLCRTEPKFDWSPACGLWRTVPVPVRERQVPPVMVDGIAIINLD